MSILGLLFSINDGLAQLSAYSNGVGTISNNNITAAERALWRRFGNIVVIDLAFTVGATISGNTDALFRGFPPTERGVTYRFRLPSAYDNATPAVLGINGNGEIINQWSTGGVTAKVWQGQAVYICDG